jgi:hypothetical protein
MAQKRSRLPCRSRSRCIFFICAEAVVQTSRGVQVTIQNYALTWVDVGQQDVELPIVLNGTAHGFQYDGHGAISSGATSRLLHDYAETERSRILDYLFQPRLGAALHHLKVEIGGDTQSSFGTEPSHMHRPSDISCERGYELWLIREARSRNPGIRIYALAWGMPHWVGFRDGSQHGFYGQDSIDYLIAWLTCVRNMGVGEVDYLGHRSEREWGPVEWTVQLRTSLDTNGFNHTSIMIPDGNHDASIIHHVNNNTMFAEALRGGGVALHYPCFLELPEVHDAGLKYWSSEDWNSQGDWKGAACLGRLLNQNFVRMNVTSTLAKYLLWSTYRNPLAPHESSSLVFADEPWSGHHVLQAPIWTMAHTTHFVDVGWTILGTAGGQQHASSGRLIDGGSYVTYVSPEKDHFTLVVEKLHGDCNKCIGQITDDEDLTFCLVGGLEIVPYGRLEFWSTNATHAMVNLTDLSVRQNERCFHFLARRDTIYTITSRLYVVPTPNVSNITDVFTMEKDYASLEGGHRPSCPENNTNCTESQSNGSTSRIAKVSASETATPASATSQTTTTVSATSQVAASVQSSAMQVSDGNVSTVNASVVGLNVELEAIVIASDIMNVSEPFPGYSVPDSMPFPRRHADDFEDYLVNRSPRYFADYAGSWQVAQDPTRPSNKVLKQWVINQAHANQWAPDTDPITLIGDALSDVSVSVDMYLPPYPVPHSGIRVDTINIQSLWGGMCLGVAGQALWSGAAAEALNCSSDWYQQLTFDSSDGSIRMRRAAKCLSAYGCPGRIGDPTRAEICFQDCCGSFDEQASCAAGQSWQWESDRAIRPQGQSSTCITVVQAGRQSAGGIFGDKLRLLPCSEPAPSARQQWLPTTTSYASYAGICARTSLPPFRVPERHKARSGYCLNLGVDEQGRGVWQLEKEGAVVLARGMPDLPTGYWHRLALDVRGSWITAMVDGHPPATVSDNSFSSGMIALNSAWGEAYFDNFTIGDADPDIMNV